MNCNRIDVDTSCNIVVRDTEFVEGTVYIYILQFNGPSTPCVQIFVKESSDEEVKFTFDEDGFYTLCTINITTNDDFTHYYKDGNLYFNGEEISLQELIQEDTSISGASISYQSYFRTCNLETCYYKACKEFIDTLENNCSSKIDKELQYKIDLLQIALDSIRYLVSVDKYNEAQFILNKIVGCNGLCVTSNTDCGCGK